MPVMAVIAMMAIKYFYALLLNSKQCNLYMIIVNFSKGWRRAYAYKRK